MKQPRIQSIYSKKKKNERAEQKQWKGKMIHNEVPNNTLHRLAII